MQIAYFINQYPKVSHSFIRREILALEQQGFRIERFALRGWNDVLADPVDLQEREKTRYILQGGLLRLLMATVRVGLGSPFRFLKALRIAFQQSVHSDRALPYHLIYLAEACQVVLWSRQMKIRHIHAHFGSNPAEIAMLAQALGGPGYSFTVHGPEEFDKPMALGLGRKITQAAFVIGISSFGRSQLFRWISSDQWHKVHVVHCGIEPEFHNLPAMPVPDVPRLVCVGRLCEQKGQLLLLEAARQLHASQIDFSLVLAGDGEMRAEIEARIRDYGLTHHVTITGWISSDEVRNQMLTARALVLPSFAEGLPVVIMEAMALRRPVITTYVAGIPELVQHGESGWLVPAGDVDSLYQAMREALDPRNNERLDRMGSHARDRVLHRHDIHVEAGKLAAQLRKVTA